VEGQRERCRDGGKGEGWRKMRREREERRDGLRERG
jgi:hypothetical protein